MDRMETLAYAEMKNRISDTDRLNYVYQKLGLGASSSETNQNILNNILSNTTIKRACCQHFPKGGSAKTVSVPVRLPIPKRKGDDPLSIDDSTGTGKSANKYGYYDYLAEVDVNEQNCGNYTKYDPDGTEGSNCDKFYELYCNNIVEEYLDAKGGEWNAADFKLFNDYKPECACFVPIPKEWQSSSVTNTFVPQCLLTGCKNSPYIDKVSRFNDECNMTVCLADLTFNGNVIDQGNLDLSNAVTQKCGGDSQNNTNTGGTTGGSGSKPSGSGGTTGGSDSKPSGGSTADKSFLDDSTLISDVKNKTVLGVSLISCCLLIICIIIFGGGIALLLD